MLKTLVDIPHDKLLHFYYGSLLAAGVNVLAGVAWSMLVVVAVAIGKEVYDKYNKGTVDVWDAVWTVLGGAVVWISNAKEII